jgi:GNAT superfamily N-acetyltransferase
MSESGVTIRLATPDDIAGISHVRFAVRENAMTPEQLLALGITPDSVAASLLADRRGWVAEDAGRIVAFSMADRATSSIFALFVLPEYERKGLGRLLLDRAVRWLWEQDTDLLWLNTGAGTRAAGFYQRAGWRLVGTDANGELRFELSRAT